jgi:hypothetical protein
MNKEQRKSKIRFERRKALIMLLLIFALLIGFPVYRIYQGNKMRNILDNGPKKIIKVKVSSDYEKRGYKYYFIVNDKKYSGNSNYFLDKPNDSLLIEYSIENPDWNRPVELERK